MWLLKSGRQIIPIIFALKAPTKYFYLVPLFIEKDVSKHLVSRNTGFKTCIREKQNSKNACHTFTIRKNIYFLSNLSNEKLECPDALKEFEDHVKYVTFATNCRKPPEPPLTHVHSSKIPTVCCSMVFHSMQFSVISIYPYQLHFSTLSFSH